MLKDHGQTRLDWLLWFVLFLFLITGAAVVLNGCGSSHTILVDKQGEPLREITVKGSALSGRQTVTVREVQRP